MKKILTIILSAFAFLMVLSAQGLPEGEGRDLVEAQCGSCHGLEAVTAQKASKDGWAGIVEYMLSRGMVASDDEVEVMVNYLAKAFPADAKGKGK